MKSALVSFSPRFIVETNQVEKEEKTLASRNGALPLTFTPFQIKTLKLVME